MDFNTFMLMVFCWIDDWLQKQPRVRQRGPMPVLNDSEVLTIEVVGEFMGIEIDSGLYQHFCRYHAAEFPLLGKVSRVTFVRQAANLWKVKERLWQDLLKQIKCDPAISIIDSFPLPMACFGRAHRSRRLRDWSAWGYDDTIRQKFFGLRAHVRICWPGVIVGFALHPANLHDRWVADDMHPSSPGWLLGDGNYWSPLLFQDLQAKGIHLVTPRKSSVRRRHPWPHWLIQTRRRIETVIGQLADRYSGKRTWVHDSWHLCSRWLRKILSHTFAVLFSQLCGLDSSIRFADLVTS
jgi:hypothetical protein